MVTPVPFGECIIPYKVKTTAPEVRMDINLCFGEFPYEDSMEIYLVWHKIITNQDFVLKVCQVMEPSTLVSRGIPWGIIRNTIALHDIKLKISTGFMGT